MAWLLCPAVIYVTHVTECDTAKQLGFGRRAGPTCGSVRRGHAPPHHAPPEWGPQPAPPAQAALAGPGLTCRVGSGAGTPLRGLSRAASVCRSGSVLPAERARGSPRGSRSGGPLDPVRARRWQVGSPIAGPRPACTARRFAVRGQRPSAFRVFSVTGTDSGGYLSFPTPALLPHVSWGGSWVAAGGAGEPPLGPQPEPVLLHSGTWCAAGPLVGAGIARNAPPCPRSPGACPTASKITTEPCPRGTYLRRERCK